jgi:hypothetical protein
MTMEDWWTTTMSKTYRLYDTVVTREAGFS